MEQRRTCHVARCGSSKPVHAARNRIELGDATAIDAGHTRRLRQPQFRGCIRSRVAATASDVAAHDGHDDVATNTGTDSVSGGRRCGGQHRGSRSQRCRHHQRARRGELGHRRVQQQ